MTDEVNLAFASVDQRDGSFRFVSEREGVLTRPHPGASAAVMLWRLDVVLASQRFREGAPLAGAGQTTISRLDRKAYKRWPEAALTLRQGRG